MLTRRTVTMTKLLEKTTYSFAGAPAAQAAPLCQRDSHVGLRWTGNMPALAGGASS
jgi:hypothetical protein